MATVRKRTKTKDCTKKGKERKRQIENPKKPSQPTEGVLPRGFPPSHNLLFQIFLFISLILESAALVVLVWWLYLLVAPADVAGEVVHVVVFIVERWGRGADEVVGLDVGRGHLVEEWLRAHTALQVVSTIHSTHLSVPM